MHTPPCGCGNRNKIVAVAVAVEIRTATDIGETTTSFKSCPNILLVSFPLHFQGDLLLIIFTSILYCLKSSILVNKAVNYQKEIEGLTSLSFS